jgi:hypothetical protein
MIATESDYLDVNNSQERKELCIFECVIAPPGSNDYFGSVRE